MKLSNSDLIISHIFEAHYSNEEPEFTFARAEIEQAASELQLRVPLNLGDLVYQYRYRRKLPESILEKAPEGQVYRIRGVGRGAYRFLLGPPPEIYPSEELEPIRVPDATPGLITLYALGDEQALLARLRYNRLVDIFLNVACYSLQNHLRTYVPTLGQLETDELYVGLDEKGLHYVVPVQAKGGSDILSTVQIEQDFALCRHKFPELTCRAIAAQFMNDGVIAMFQFMLGDDGFADIVKERHYQLVPPNELGEPGWTSVLRSAKRR